MSDLVREGSAARRFGTPGRPPQYSTPVLGAWPARGTGDGSATAVGGGDDREGGAIGVTGAGGTEATVSRALKLISEGALDGGNLEQLAERVSEQSINSRDKKLRSASFQ